MLNPMAVVLQTVSDSGQERENGSTTMHIREATAADLPAIVRLNEVVQKLHAERHPEFFRHPQDPDEVHRFFADKLEGRNMLLVAVADDEQPVGYLWAEARSSPQNAFRYARNMLMIHQLCVVSHARRQGVGTALMRQAQERATRMRIETLVLGSWSFNAEAHAFFRRMGFTEFQVEMWRPVDRAGTPAAGERC